MMKLRNSPFIRGKRKLHRSATHKVIDNVIYKVKGRANGSLLLKPVDELKSPKFTLFTPKRLEKDGLNNKNKEA